MNLKLITSKSNLNARISLIRIQKRNITEEEFRDIAKSAKPRVRSSDAFQVSIPQKMASKRSAISLSVLKSNKDHVTRHSQVLEDKLKTYLSQNLKYEHFNKMIALFAKKSQSFEKKMIDNDKLFTEEVADVINEKTDYQTSRFYDEQPIIEKLERKRIADLIGMFASEYQGEVSLSKRVELPSTFQKATFIEMMKAGCHLGTKGKVVNQRMNQFHYCISNGQYIFDVTKSLAGLRKIMFYLQEIVRNKGRIWFVGNSPQAKSVVEELAYECDEGYLTSPSIPGMLSQFNKWSKKYRNPKFFPMKDHDRDGIIEVVKFSNIYRNLDGPPDTIVFLTREGNQSLIEEANRERIPTVGLCDSDTLTNDLTYVIPGSNKTQSSIRFFMQMMSMAIRDVKDQLNYRKDLVDMMQKSNEEERKRALREKVMRRVKTNEGLLQVEKLNRRIWTLKAINKNTGFDTSKEELDKTLDKIRTLKKEGIKDDKSVAADQISF